MNIIDKIESSHLGTLPLFHTAAENWGECAKLAQKSEGRWVSMWAQEFDKNWQITAVIYYQTQYMVFRTTIDKTTPQIASHSKYFPGASRIERHIHDLYGIIFLDAPDQRRWTRHQAWQENQFPLQKGFVTKNNSPTPADYNYPFLSATGTGIYAIPVGPIHAGIIEPGHFRFQVAGEDILYLEERLGYLHKGIEKAAVGRDVNSLLKLAEKISGDATVAHTWATCQAIEHACKIEVSARTNYLRAILAERERIANHLWDIAAICNDVGFAFAYYQLGRLRELWLRTNALVYGHRLLMHCLTIGGVTLDLTAQQIEMLLQQIIAIRDDFSEIYKIIENNSSLQNRIRTTGILEKELAQKLGTLGFVAKASGIDFDVRTHNSYAPYDHHVLKTFSLNEGDVAARLKVRAKEIFITLDLLKNLLTDLPNGDYQNTFEMPKIATEGIGIIESWRGEIVTYVSLDATGKVTRFFPRDPSWFNWLALEQLVYHDIVPDFPVCNKSINGSYAGCDL